MQQGPGRKAIHVPILYVRRNPYRLLLKNMNRCAPCIHPLHSDFPKLRCCTAPFNSSRKMDRGAEDTLFRYSRPLAPSNPFRSRFSVPAQFFRAGAGTLGSSCLFDRPSGRTVTQTGSDKSQNERVRDRLRRSHLRHEQGAHEEWMPGQFDYPHYPLVV